MVVGGGGGGRKEDGPISGIKSEVVFICLCLGAHHAKQLFDGSASLVLCSAQPNRGNRDAEVWQRQ